MSFFSKMFGSNDKQVKKIQPLVDAITALEPEMQKLADAELPQKTIEFKKRLADGETLDDLLPEAFALTREASRRVMGERHYDVQLVGGVILHQGKIAEMKTGEGKNLTSTLAIYLNALTGKGVHVVTVNDYLAKRDCNWMGSIYDILGITTACITHEGGFQYTPNTLDVDSSTIEYENLVPIEKKEAYALDITYGTNNEFGFDYLRDNMAQSAEAMVQREKSFAIVDEVDSILIDEARTPLIISAPDSESTKLYEKFAHIVPKLVIDKDYTLDEKMKGVSLTDEGITRVEEILGVGNIYEAGKVQYVHHLEQSLKAQIIFHIDKDYLVRNGEVIIIDDFTGRAMEGRRYSDGLHQAIEAKENVVVQRESRTLATITFQNYFRMYDKLSGMTGTAQTSAEEFQKVYELETVEIPANQPLIRDDKADVIYKTEKGKFLAIATKIKALNAKGQPVLVGTVAVEKSEALSAQLKKSGISHSVLNAKHHEEEASVVVNAGQKGSVTIATNMAGRGTDIKLGEGVKELGGLYIIGTERHEARRIDDQLRGRSGRQGDPGTTQFYISLDDELMIRFGGDKLKSMMERFGLPDDQPIQNKMISKQIEGAQSKIEGFNFDIRKHVLDYDDVVNKQREVIYEKRRTVLTKDDIKGDIMDYLHEEMENIVAHHAAHEDYQWNLDEIKKDAQGIFTLPGNTAKRLEEIRSDKSKEDREKIGAMTDYLVEEGKKAYQAKEKEFGDEQMRKVEKAITLQTVDTHWMNHLDEIEQLRQGIGLRGYGQRDPLIEYKKEAYNIFMNLLSVVRASTLTTLYRAHLAVNTEAPVGVQAKEMQLSGTPGQVKQFGAFDRMQAQANGQNAVTRPIKKTEKEAIGRNDPCFCGSGKKYKKCHGKGV